MNRLYVPIWNRPGDDIWTSFVGTKCSREGLVQLGSFDCSDIEPLWRKLQGNAIPYNKAEALREKYARRHNKVFTEHELLELIGGIK